ncbi:Scr1 family TA system antitoxin-like transcriptional regulator [Nocardiopsis aegyptia]|uniref:Transcriptional regulator with XRE-family HTH domain n=1 Tax=Nocardiopsis aegyptia TaxID=220378 RepID=A0A7Z0ET74_9ACTN|nr:Scr1 family TA system antitoxin-like transcriptional regulator [Nocardiopsis aegyptia]NYJ37341.1 transcriptional regulator with XRE-family HTH domain [Nocardiopsis aegyptia]
MADPPFNELLKRFRELQGLTQQQLAARVRASPASVSRWANGHGIPHKPTAELLDEHLNAGGRLMSAWRMVANGTTLPEWARGLADIEIVARFLEFLSPVLVPGYLQSPSYARQVFRAGQPLLPEKDIANLVKLRCERLEQLHSLSVSAVFPVLGIRAFGRGIQQEQAAHLLSWIATGRVTVLLVPEGSVLAGITSPLLVFTLQDGTMAASSDHVSGNFIHDDESHPRLTALVKGALSSALPVRESRRILEGLSNE